uniref:Uncharacterized protein n=1 Tax=Anguilla anguilla TaxID=7936 RepID=A0A0E9WHL7_ANGAN
MDSTSLTIRTLSAHFPRQINTMSPTLPQLCGTDNSQVQVSLRLLQGFHI